MEDQRFDTLTRSLAAGTSRRTVLRRLAAGLLGGAAVARGLQATGAQPQPKVGICHVDGEGRSRYQEINANAVPAHEAHGDAIDPDFSSDNAHCGGCGIVCGTGTTCVDSACAPTGIVVTGEITSADPAFSCGAGTHYETHTFDHPGGPLSLGARGASSGGGSLPFLAITLYTGVLGDPCTTGSVASDGGGGCGNDAYLEVNVAAGTYTALVGGVGVSNQFGTYTFERDTFSGGAC